MTQKVAIVNGSPEILTLLETVLEGGAYDAIFVESIGLAYSQIKSAKPHLVILCVSMDDLAGFLVLTMLKLDEETRLIPVLTCTTEYDDQRGEGDEEPSDLEMFTPSPDELMN